MGKNFFVVKIDAEQLAFLYHYFMTQLNVAFIHGILSIVGDAFCILTGGKRIKKSNLIPVVMLTGVISEKFYRFNWKTQIQSNSNNE